MKYFSAVLLILASLQANSAIISYDFAQHGFANGGSLSGQFSGDASIDGDASNLSLLDLTGFSLIYSGDLGSFSAVLGDLGGFFLAINGDNELGNDALEGFEVDNGSFYGVGGEGFYGNPGTYLERFSDAASDVSASVVQLTPRGSSIPEPGVLLMMGLGLLLLRASRNNL